MPAEIETTDIVVIGGGVAGLAAARELARQGLRVILLEARPRLGGRIFTGRPRHWRRPVELGAEFIHVGNSDLWRLIRQARLKVRRLPDRHWLSQESHIKKIPDLDERLACVTRQILPRRAGNLSFGAYFRRHPAKVSRQDWQLARGFVEGFEAAPLDRISARSLAGEAMDEQRQYAIPGGYDQVVAALAAGCSRNSVRVKMGVVVRSIEWRRGRVKIIARRSRTGGQQEFIARAAVITLPLGVLQSRRGIGAVRFQPPLKRQQKWIDRMQVGHVIRLGLRLKPAFWRRITARMPATAPRKAFGFVHSVVQGVPVWWSLSNRPVLIGWAGGPAAKRLLKLSAAVRRQRALRSLAEILQVAPAALSRAVIEWQGHDWTHDPFSRGAYSFTAAGEDATAKKLRTPIQGTIFFAGEATADGAEVGTVHGALSSGIRAARAAQRSVKPRILDVRRTGTAGAKRLTLVDR